MTALWIILALYVGLALGWYARGVERKPEQGFPRTRR